MCGIIGVRTNEDCMPFLMEGLARLEYRGYDSVGIALLHQGHIERYRNAGKLANLKQFLNGKNPQGHIGIGHTRWATHGVPNESNCHPHMAGEKTRLALVHNGIIENFQQLKKDANITCESETDSEVLAHLIAREVEKGEGIAPAIRRVAKKIKGSFACVILVENDPSLYAVTRGLPLAIGKGKGRSFIASDGLAMAGWAEQIAYMKDGDCLILGETIHLTDWDGNPKTLSFQPLDINPQSASKGEFDDFMKKEIYEQPQAMRRLLSLYTKNNDVMMPDFPNHSAIKNLLMIGCGGSVHAAMVARYWVEKYAHLPVREELASEFRDRHAVIQDDTLIIFISQSGETADSLAAFHHCQRLGHPAVAIVNVPQSTMAREADLTLLMNAGPEISVASTKALTSQMALLALTSLYLARSHHHMSLEESQAHISALRHLPLAMEACLSLDSHFQAIAETILAQASYLLYLGRGAYFPVALEGALKSKEITYIPSEGYAAGEMKHGPIALIDDKVPVIALGPDSALFDKLLSNLQEVVARGGKVILISDKKGCVKAGDLPIAKIVMPDMDDFTAPILYVMAVQFLAYHTARKKGLDVDRPRNLAKSVTVE